MATARKLKAELELDTRRARQQARDVVDAAAGSGGGSGGTDSAASASADKAAKALDKLSNSGEKAASAAEGMSRGTINLVRGLTGMAAGMALNYAKQYVPEGKYRDAVGIGSAAMSGGGAGLSIGASIGGLIPHPLAKAAVTAGGAVIGAAGGALGEYFGQRGQEEAFRKDFARGESDYADARAWREQLKALSEVGRNFTDFSGKIKEVEAELDKLREAERKTVAEIERAAGEHRYGAADELRGELSKNRSRQGQLEGVRDRFASMQEAAGSAASFRESHGAADALSRVGGAFTADSGSAQTVRTLNEQLQVLRSIDSKTKAGGATWQ